MQENISNKKLRAWVIYKDLGSFILLKIYSF